MSLIKRAAKNLSRKIGVHQSARLDNAAPEDDQFLGDAPAKAETFDGRFRDIISDPLNILIERDPRAGSIKDGHVYLHNGNRVPLRGLGSYCGRFMDVLVYNRGVHEPLEELAFQEVMKRMGSSPSMIELGAYWAHYSMWLKRLHPDARCFMVEPDEENLVSGQHNFKVNGFSGNFFLGAISKEEVQIDDFCAEHGLDHLDILHSDIQGYELDMLHGAQNMLSNRKVDYLFISTHNDAVHEKCMSALREHAYKIDIECDVDTETTSFDGFILAIREDLPSIFHGEKVLGRGDLLHSSSEQIVQSINRFAKLTQSG